MQYFILRQFLRNALNLCNDLICMEVRMFFVGVGKLCNSAEIQINAHEIILGLLDMIILLIFFFIILCS